MLEKAKNLLANGTVTRVLGWKKGEMGYDVEPAVFSSEAELDNFVYNVFCGANLSKYLVQESKKEGKILVFLKPCDTYSFNQLLTEHRFDREKVYAVGIPCEGMVDIDKIKKTCDGISSIESTENGLKVQSLYGEESVIANERKS